MPPPSPPLAWQASSPSTVDLPVDNLPVLYHNLTHHLIPGPQSISYGIPLLLLPFALAIPPERMSHQALRLTFLPIMYACILHAWWCIGGLDVISVTSGLWCTSVIGIRDVRSDARRVFWRARVEDRGEKESGGVRRPETEGARSVSGQDVRVEGFRQRRAGRTPERKAEAKGEPMIQARKDDEHSTEDDESSTADHGEVVEERYPIDGLRERWKWILVLLVSLRLVGWRVGDRSHDRTQPYKPMSRLAYIKHASSVALLGYLVLDASFLYVPCDPYFTVSGIGVDDPYLPSSCASNPFFKLLQNLPPRLLRCCALAAQVFALVSGGFYLSTIPAVLANALGLFPEEWSPHAWPHFYGRFSAVYDRGLRGLWGTWWHQMEREITGNTGRALASLLGLPPRSFARYTFMVATAFFLSGTVHMGMIPPQPLSQNLSVNMMRLYIGGFFWCQAPGIGIETLVSKLTYRYAPGMAKQPWIKMVAFTWTGCWLCLTLPLLVVPFREIGYWRGSPVPLSVLRFAHDGWRKCGL